MNGLQQYLEQIKGKQIAVIGAGVSNMPLIARLRAAGICVTVHDRKTQADLGEQYTQLAQLGVTMVLGETYLEALEADIVFRTPGLHPNHPALQKARKRGAIVTSEMELFFAVCPCTIIGITGSDGKTTTTTLVYKMLQFAGHTCHLGGNIGKPLLADVEQMRPEDFAVVELSSFQLMGMPYSPKIAAITNLTPNHLDYHGTFSEYVDAKTNIYLHQKAGDKLVLNGDDRQTHALEIPEGRETIVCTKLGRPENGVYLRDGVIYIAKNGQSRMLMRADEIRIPGAHNVSNVMMAAGIVQDFCTDEQIATVARTFGGVEHRIEFVREVDGVSYYNDSIASSPTRTMAGLYAFSQKLILIAGGYDKKIPYDELGAPICERVKTLILMGATAPKIRASVMQQQGQKPEILEAADLQQAVQLAQQLAQKGDVVLLSPASASFDQFRNFMERGDCFKACVNRL